MAPAGLGWAGQGRVELNGWACSSCCCTSCGTAVDMAVLVLPFFTADAAAGCCWTSLACCTYRKAPMVMLPLL